VHCLESAHQCGTAEERKTQVGQLSSQNSMHKSGVHITKRVLPQETRTTREALAHRVAISNEQGRNAQQKNKKPSEGLQAKKKLQSRQKVPRFRHVTNKATFPQAQRARRITQSVGVWREGWNTAQTGEKTKRSWEVSRREPPE